MVNFCLLSCCKIIFSLLRGSNKVVSVPIPAKLTSSTVLLKSEVRKNDFILMGVFIIRETEKGFQIYFLNLGLKAIDTSKMKAYLTRNRAKGALWSKCMVEAVLELVSTASSHLLGTIQSLG